MIPYRDITLAITSCGRFSLLEKTIQSIEQSIDISQYKKILTEDSRDTRHIEKMQEANKNGFLQGWTIIYTLGSGHTDVLRCHYSALQTLYDNIDTPYVFHCEDDQVFDRVEYDFIQLSYDILENNKNIAIPILRDLYKDYGLQKQGIMRSKYYDILTDNEVNLYGHDFIYCTPDATFTLQPGLRRTQLMKKVMFGYENTVNEVSVSRRLADLGYHSIYIKEGIYYNPNWRFNSTRSIRNMGYIKYIKTTFKNAVSYRLSLISKYIRYLLSKK